TIGRNTTTVISALVSSMIASATIEKTISPVTSSQVSRNSISSNTSSRKRLTASPGDPGTTRAPGPCISPSGKLTRSSSSPACQNVIQQVIHTSSTAIRRASEPTNSAISGQALPAEGALASVSKNARMIKPVASGMNANRTHSTNEAMNSQG